MGLAIESLWLALGGPFLSEPLLEWD